MKAIGRSSFLTVNDRPRTTPLMGAEENRSSTADASAARDYAESIVETLHEPLLVLHPDLTVKRVNPAFYDHFKVDPKDTIGREIYSLGNGQWNIPALRTLLEDVLPERNVFNAYEVNHNFEGIGRRVMLINARRVKDNQLILLGIRDITERKQAEREAAEAREFAESIVETLHEPLLVLHPDLTVKSVNPAFYDHFKVNPKDTIGRSIYDLGNGQWNISALRTLLEDVLPDSKIFNDYEVSHDFEDIGQRVMLLNARRLDHVQQILLGIRDITEKRRTDEALRESERLAILSAGQEEERKRIARDLHDELGQQLTALRLKLEGLAGNAPASDPIREVMALAKKLDDAVDFIAWEMRPAALGDAGLIDALRSFVREWSRYSGVKGTLVAPSNWPSAGEAFEAAVYRVVQEAMNNINKHAAATSAVVTLTQQGLNILLTIDDDGRGFDPDDVETKERGLGLTGMEERVQMAGGTFEIESSPGRGTTIFARFPTQPMAPPPAVSIEYLTEPVD